MKSVGAVLMVLWIADAAVLSPIGRRTTLQSSALLITQMLPSQPASATSPKEQLALDEALLQEMLLDQREIQKDLRITQKYEKQAEGLFKQEAKAAKNPLAIATESARSPFERLDRAERISQQEDREADVIDADKAEVEYLQEALQADRLKIQELKMRIDEDKRALGK